MAEMTKGGLHDSIYFVAVLSLLRAARQLADRPRRDRLRPARAMSGAGCTRHNGAVRRAGDRRRAVFDCGVAYIGLDIPAYLENGLTAPGSVWDVDPSADNSIVGGHCVTLAGYDANGNFRAISWGSYYTLTSAFLLQRMDEAYGLVSPDWMKATGQTPAGLTVAQWQAQMAALQEQGT